MPTQLFLLRPTTTASTATISHPSKPPRISLKTTLRCPYWFRSRRSNIVARSSGDEWKLDKDVVREKMSSWLVKARGMFKDVASPLVNSPQGRSLGIAAIDSDDGTEIENVIKLFLKTSEVTLNRKTPTGYLSPAAVLSIEQFGRMNGLTGRKIQQIYEDVAPEHIRYDARSLVEYACFRYLSKDRSIIRASLKDIAFQRLIFIAMLAWQQPYTKDGDLHTSLEKLSFQLVGIQSPIS
ncbi:hypothetical protein ZOSMA_35G00130 [Zostera marina]|uniref:Uncharacterized protein n=1 Tax=Zostera marina TaxID=29655 RepID=A0A0K9P6B7_ZOSMR|nr:hypothetical protein ZOSMA_35G00130 [Zostera marina]